jgi:hypothetical protein
MEFNTALKPFMIRHLIESGFSIVLYFDPDIEVFAPLDVVIDPLRAGCSFILTPHICQPAEGDAFPDDIGIMRAGIYNLGFLGRRIALRICLPVTKMLARFGSGRFYPLGVARTRKANVGSVHCLLRRPGRPQDR